MVLVSVLITITGLSLIYNATNDGIEKEVTAAAETLEHLFKKEFPGDFWKDGYIYRFGDKAVVSEDFYEIVDYISCSDDVVFSIFYQDKRTFTTVVNPSGSSPVGAKAEDKVLEQVFKGGKRVIFDKVDIYGTDYMGYYIPIISENGEAAGMYFAGKPLEMVAKNTRTVVIEFIIVALMALSLSLLLCIFVTEAMVKDLGDIKQYINKVAKGEFNAKMGDKTLKRMDEIGDIGRDAQKLCTSLRDMVECDPLTMLLNRRSSRLKLDELLENNMLCTVVMGDIDFFKNINDTYGHAAGDYVLKEVSEVLKRYAVENSAFAARWGGEEFLLVFASKTAKETHSIISAVLDEIRRTKYTLGDETVKVTMTFGIAQIESDDNAETLVNRADRLLYEGKQSGRNKIVM